MNIVVLDGYAVNPGDNPWDGLAALGSLEVYDRTSSGDIGERGKDADIILANKTPLRSENLAELERLRFVAVLATGYDNVDVVEAGRRGIPVANVPEYGTDSVAQHTMALLLALTNRVGEHDAAVKEGEWSASSDFSFCRGALLELAGKKIGIIGLGRIGRRVAAIARSFGMEILAYNPRSRDMELQFPVRWLGVRDLCTESDVVTLHCPLSGDTVELVDETFLSTMKRGALFINTARGGLVREADLARALAEGWIAGAGLDVVAREPMAGDNPLLHAPNCIITPHIAWATLDARKRLMEAAVNNVAAFLRGELVNCVNSAYLAEAGKRRAPSGE